MKPEDGLWLVDALTSEVMQAHWRNNALCAHIDTYNKSAKREQETLCAACPVSEPCFWAALIEERAFRSASVDPPGVRGGVNGAKRRFILRELTDQQIMDRYRIEAQNCASRSSAA
jgi:Transcription factor WhiB